jgi:Na+-transporting methylmalonyl-CoA/oxaloacetate decarboxylase gamma subunit
MNSNMLNNEEGFMANVIVGGVVVIVLILLILAIW